MTGERRNSVLIVADQLRHDFIDGKRTGVVLAGFDRLRASGTTFTNAITNATVCAPARIALTSGLLPHRLGALSNRSRLPAYAPTIYQALAAQGVTTGLVGKADLDKPDPIIANDQTRAKRWGLTRPHETEGQRQAAMAPSPRGPYGRWLAQQGLYETYHRDLHERYDAGILSERGTEPTPLPLETTIDHYVADQAIDWLQRHHKQPFHLLISFPGPHEPFDAPREFLSTNRAEQPASIPPTPSLAPGLVERTTHLPPMQRQRVIDQYIGKIRHIDHHIGRVLDTLEDLGLSSSTLLALTSDHGELLGDHALWEKMAPYEGALRVPLIVATPGSGPAVNNRACAELIDVTATLADWHRTDLGEIDGVSLLPGVGNRSWSPRDWAVSIEHPFRVLRGRRHKLVVNPNADDELYDLETDPNEQVNLVRHEPELVTRMQRRLELRLI